MESIQGQEVVIGKWWKKNDNKTQLKLDDILNE
jgi:hypothetical protein